MIRSFVACVVAGLALATPGVTARVRWVPVGETKRYSLYYDEYRVSTMETGGLRGWQRFVFKGKNPIRSINAQFEVSCYGSIALGPGSAYRSDQSLFATWNLWLPADDVAPDSPQAALSDAACA